jgi:hypothetical protein
VAPRPAFEELDRLLKLGNGNLRKTTGVRLIRHIFDAITRETLPVSDPNPAERAIAIEDEDRTLSVGGH